MRNFTCMIGWLCLTYISQSFADTSVNIVGLFPNKAVVMINGASPRMMQVGQVFQGVKLVSADSQKATVLIDGKSMTMGLGQAANVVSNSGATTDAQTTTLYADARGQFSGQMKVNGVDLKYMVDTGATGVAMNSADAKFAKINYTNGRRGRATTAMGEAPFYAVKVPKIKLGGIDVYDVEVIVIEGGYPEEVLLGMNVLNRLKMQREYNKLTLTKMY